MRRTAGTPRTRTIMLDPLPLTQSAELQMRRPEAMTTDTNLVPMLKRHGCASWETACTVKLGILPAWYQYCGDERRSVTAPGAQASAFPAAGERVVLRCGEGTDPGRGEAGDARRAPPPLACATAEPAALVPPEEASNPFTVQLRTVSNPMPTAKTVTRRRQYVVGEIPADRVRALRGGPESSRRLADRARCSARLKDVGAGWPGRSGPPDHCAGRGARRLAHRG